MSRAAAPSSRTPRARSLIWLAIAVIVPGVAAADCATEPETRSEPTVPATLLQPADFPTEPERFAVGDTVDDASNSWACAGVEDSALMENGWDSESVLYYGKTDPMVSAAAFTGGGDAAAALDDLRAEIDDCRESLASEGHDEAVVDLEFTGNSVAYQSNDPDGEREGQRAYAIAGSAIVQITVLGDGGKKQLSLRTLLERAVERQ